MALSKSGKQSQKSKTKKNGIRSQTWLAGMKQTPLSCYVKPPLVQRTPSYMQPACQKSSINEISCDYKAYDEKS